MSNIKFIRAISAQVPKHGRNAPETPVNRTNLPFCQLKLPFATIIKTIFELAGTGPGNVGRRYYEPYIFYR